MAQNPKCSPLENTINAPIGPPLPGLPGFSYDINIFTAVPSFPGIPEDIFNYLRKLKFKIPGGGLLQRLVDTLAESVAKILSSLLSYLNAAMGWLMFVMAIIEMILCIIKVLCAYPKPWSVIRAIKRLIRKCLPIFITICFPFFAWLILILTLIAILLALIQYIIAMIKRLIQQILKNLRRLYKLVYVQRTPNAALAIITKLANLLCLFETVFEFLGFISALIDVISGQWNKILTVCKSGGAASESDDVCPPFLQNPAVSDNPDIELYKTRVNADTGTMWYCNVVYGIPYAPIPTAVTTVRNEVVYLKDDNLIDELKFKNIISCIINSNTFPFFPFDKNINKDIEFRLKPYFIDLYVTADPGDGYGSRQFFIKDITVTYVNDLAVQSVINSVPQYVINSNGYLQLSGGETINDPNAYNGKTIEQVLGQKDKPASPRNGDPTYLNGSYVEYTDISYVLKANYEALAEYNLITMKCFPSIQIEFGVLEAVFDKAFNFSLPDFVVLPDVATAIDDMGTCLSDYRKNITIDTTTVFGTCMENIMNDLNTQATNTYCQLLQAAIDIYNTTITADPDLQFVGSPIAVTVTPTDQAGRTLADLIGSFDVPATCSTNLASLFDGQVTLGTISSFTYDGYGNFIADINSTESGDGYLNVYFDGNIIKQTIKPDDPNEQPSVIDYTVPYTFIGFDNAGITGIRAELPGIRRDETDNT